MKLGSQAPVVALIIVAFAATIAGVAIGIGDLPIVPVLAALNALVLAVALVARLASHGARHLDVFEPLMVFLVGWATMFVIRPVGMIVFDDMTLRGLFDVRDGVPAALLLAAVGSFAFALAYSTRLARGMATVVHDRAADWTVRPGVRNTLATVCIALAAAGGLASSANIESAYVQYLPLLAVPGALLLLGVDRPRWSLAPVVALGALILPLLQALAVGQRSTVLFVAGSLAVLHYLRRGTRPRVATLMVGTVVLLLLIVNSLEVLRGPMQAGEPFDLTRIATEDLSPDAAIKRLVTGGSTEMLPALALQIETEGTTWTITPGYLVASIAAHWVPGGLWADKPLSSAELLYSRYFPEWYAESKANSQFSVIGDFYFDLGTAGVIIGMFVFGVGARLMAGVLAAAPTSRAAQFLYAPFIPLFVVLLRGDIPLTLGLALYIYGPLLIAVAASRSAPLRVAGLEDRRRLGATATRHRG